MSFINKIRTFLIGRNGVDALVVALMVIGAVASFVLSLFNVGLFRLLGYIPYILAVLRIIS